MNQLIIFALLILLGLVTLRMAYLLGRASASDELAVQYDEYTRMANRLAAAEKGGRRG
ncbi:hypothetical protein [Kushneria indalinina]|uniref:Uncharacterized protein n=1 Tax=Kushneria indalinina DSM 14324 TaxID=1122140 RepID=A0A3D9DW58_9GAMM|nr:hypothetical protein [Kushneria indalinina]REC94911.1 hypothetical protein C8D72_1740 [Kushneria indalinina DSM 14324]